MLKYLSGIFATISLLLATQMAAAVEIDQLDSSTVTVDSRANNDRSDALQQALFNVLLLNSGAKELRGNAQIQAALSNASSLVVQYSYEQAEDGLQLRATFEHDKVIRLLREAGLPVWGKQRPLTLVWLASDTEGERHLVADESAAEERQAFAKASRQRGIPLMFPLLDLDDLMAVNVNDVRGQFADTVAKASARYQADYFAMVTFDSSPDNQVQYQMSLYARSALATPFFTALVSRNGAAQDRAAAIDEIMLSLSDYFVQQYAVTDSGQADVAQIEFNNVAHMRQLVEIESFFSQLSAVKHFYIKSVQGNHVVYQLQLFGSRDDLSNVLRLEQRIRLDENQPIGSPMDSTTNNLIGVYRWDAK